MDQLIIPKLMFFYSHHLSGCYCMDIGEILSRSLMGV